MRIFIYALVIAVYMPIVSHAADNHKIPGAQKVQKAGIAEAKKTSAEEAYGKLPLYFIKNNGQVDKAVRFYEKGSGHATFFTDEAVVLALTKSEDKDRETVSRFEKPHKAVNDIKFTTKAVKLTFIGANKNTNITSSSPLPGHVNYFVGNDKTKWQSNIPTYKALTYKNIYNNIDIKFYGNNRNIEHDIIIRPGGNPSLVKFAYDGVVGLKTRGNGDLEVSLTNGVLIEKRPFIYQEIKGKRKTIEGSYKILKGEDNEFTYGYTVASYDHTKALVIDPVLTYSTYLGGSSELDSINSITVDAVGAVYVTGYTASTDFPLLNPVQAAYSGGWSDIFITKLTPAGTALVYSTYLGGSDYDDSHGIAVDNKGAVYVTGPTTSTDFPMVAPIQGIYGGDSGAFVRHGDAFITKLNPSGTAIIYSTYLGGSGDDGANDIDIDSTGAVYVTGVTTSRDFPLANPIQPGISSGSDENAFVTKINPAGNALTYSTYLGGILYDAGFSIAVDNRGAAYIAGETTSTDFPLQNPIQGVRGGGIRVFDYFITNINPAGTTILYSTYLGGSGHEHAPDIAVDRFGATYVTGYSNSTDFPLASPLQGYNAGSIDITVTKINPAGSALVYSTYLGGSSDDYGSAITVDAAGAVYIAGLSWSMDFPLVNPIQNSNAGFTDTVIAKINPAGNALLYSTYLGGNTKENAWDITVDDSGNAYIGGWTTSANFPLKNPMQVISSVLGDAFIAKISPGTLPAVSFVITPNSYFVPQGSILGYTVTATNTTATRQCFQYWENVTLQGGATYPPTGELFGPVNLCLDAGASQSNYLTHDVPLSIPQRRYALNAFIGAYGTPTPHILINEAHFTFEVTAPAPFAPTTHNSWSLIEDGFK